MATELHLLQKKSVRRRYPQSVRQLPLFLILCAACTPSTPPPVPLDADAFNAEAAWEHLMHQVDLGPRNAGSKALKETRTWIEEELKELGLAPIREEFQADTPLGVFNMANIYADFHSDVAPAGEADVVVIAAHFDTKTLTFRFVGANDGASGVAALLEIARVITSQGPRPMTYRFLFLDGEEAMRNTWVDPDNTYGSRHHVKNLSLVRGASQIRACVLLDLVADADFQLTRDSFSQKPLLEIFYSAARADGLGAHVDGPPMPIKDDHLPFMNAGIPSCDLIDFSYGDYNEHWHKASHLPSNCSEETLGIIGRIVLLGLPRVEQEYAAR